MFRSERTPGDYSLTKPPSSPRGHLQAAGKSIWFKRWMNGELFFLSRVAVDQRQLDSMVEGNTLCLIAGLMWRPNHGVFPQSFISARSSPERVIGEWSCRRWVLQGPTPERWKPKCCEIPYSKRLVPQDFCCATHMRSTSQLPCVRSPDHCSFFCDTSSSARHNTSGTNCALYLPVFETDYDVC